MYDWRKMSEEERREILSLRKRGSVPWHRPVHLDAGEDFYFVSSTCYEHAPVIGATPKRMEAFSNGLLETLESCATQTHAWCVLPNHYHTLLHAQNLKVVKKALGQLHGRTSYEWNGIDNARGRKVWFDGSDRAIRSDGHFWVTMNYIHNNPVKHGYVKKWLDWPFSSAESFLTAVGREEARKIWEEYPLRDYGKGWDD
jgi:putative transposase